ncbi:TadE/TadG family type IV pilus assembly protein [Variovorax sp. CY25R-8]|uniref:TadE/TadG family type IV pilus assembly protein n=1 Tax=Variovorax sp. CY25R-8 TaxID=2855501 RepID=UPI0021BAEAD1|nr:TadE/TadG family type IV pilus assembly protein [Variovorax sp. CY25R-8]MCT8178323.1 pilus assembly protein [Variovorax sp. CY25R-8]
MNRAARPTGRGMRKRQRGVAAIEFAFVFMMLFFIIYGIATFGAVLYIQQVISRAAEDGARAVPMLLSPPLTANDTRVRDTVYDSLAAALVAPAGSSATPQSRRTWIAANATVNVTITAAAGASGPSAVVSVTYPYSANRLLPSLPVLDTSRWMPDNLSSRATAAIPS